MQNLMQNLWFNRVLIVNKLPLIALIGLADEMRSNFHVMKELAVHTRMGPEPRVNQLNAFFSEVKKYVVSLLFINLSLLPIFVTVHITAAGFYVTSR